MSYVWDTKANVQKRGDRKRIVLPIKEKTRIDEEDNTVYIFSRMKFNNPHYIIPEENEELFGKYVKGGSRAYPSDGNIPCDVVAKEARKILNRIVDISQDPYDKYYEEAIISLTYGKYHLVRGTLKLYLGKYTTRDWRRKRFTDDIDFWMFKIHLLHHVLRKTGWSKNPKTLEWEKKVYWVHPFTGENQSQVLIAANDLDQLLDFGAGSYLEGTNLKSVFSKKIKRGHDVDLSDIMNVAMVQGADGKYKEHPKRKKEWKKSWEALIEASNTRSSSTTSNIISLCRYSMGTVDYLERVSNAIEKYNDQILDENKYTRDDIKQICQISIHWLDFLDKEGVKKTRYMLHQFYHDQISLKRQHAQNLKIFIKNVLELLNSKYRHLKIKFEIEN